MDGGDIIGLVAVVFIFGGGTISYAVKSMVRLAELKAQNIANAKNNGGVTNNQVIEELRQEIATLRDTTTRFDMSFDAALSTLENRVNRVEDRQGTVGEVSSPTEQQPRTVTVGGGR